MKRKIILITGIILIVLFQLNKSYSSSYGICVISSGKIIDMSGLGESRTVLRKSQNSNYWTGHFDQTNIRIRVLVGGKFQAYEQDHFFKYSVKNLEWKIRLYIRKNSNYSWRLVREWIGKRNSYESTTISENIFVQYSYKTPVDYYDFKIEASLSGQLTVYVRNGEGAAYSLIWVFWDEKIDNSFIGILTTSIPIPVKVSYRGKGSSGSFIGEKETPFWIKENKVEKINNIQKLNITLFFKKNIIQNNTLYSLSKINIFYKNKNRWKLISDTDKAYINIQLLSGRVFSSYRISDLHGHKISDGKVLGKIRIKIESVYQKRNSSILYIDTYPIKTEVLVNSSVLDPPINIYTIDKRLVAYVNVSPIKETYSVIDPKWSKKYYKRADTYDIFLVAGRNKNISISASIPLTGNYTIQFKFKILTWGSTLYLLKNSTIIGKWESFKKTINMKLDLKNERIIFLLKTKYRHGSIIIRDVRVRKINYYFFKEWKIFSNNHEIMFFKTPNITVNVPLGRKYYAIAYFSQNPAKIKKSKVEYFLKGETIKLTFLQKGVYNIFYEPIYPSHNPPNLTVLALLNGKPIYFDFRKITIYVKDSFLPLDNTTKILNNLPVIIDGKHNNLRLVCISAWNPFRQYRLENVFKNSTTYAVYNLTIENVNTSKKITTLIVVTTLKVDFKVIYHESTIEIIWNASIAYYPPHIQLKEKIDKKLLFTIETKDEILLTAINNGSISRINMPYQKLHTILSTVNESLIVNIRWRSLISIYAIPKKISVTRYTLWLKSIQFNPLSFEASIVDIPSLRDMDINVKEICIYVNDTLLEKMSITGKKQRYIVKTSIATKPEDSITILPIPLETKNQILLPEATKT
ncbi:MAG: hypothetical protein J7K23_04305 [Thermoproteales archaeon]|nr:hypothetical protein [Thermoproteales archaeon]